MLTLKDLLEDNVDWDEVEIDDEEFERLSTQLGEMVFSIFL